MNDLLHEIVEVITSDYNGSLIADEQRADLHVYKDGQLSSDKRNQHSIYHL